MSTLKITISSKSKLSPITEAEINQYAYYALTCINQTAELANGTGCPDLTIEWNNTESERDVVKHSYLGETMRFMWEYAEQGLHLDEMKKGNFYDPLMQLYRWTATCDAYLVHLGSFGEEPLEVMEVGSKLAYKFIARLKLDLNLDMSQEFIIANIYPMSHDTELTTLEYALLSGFSHIGAVRNEVSNKSDPLKVSKTGNQTLISVDEARKRLAKKRKFTQTIEVDF